MHRIILFGPDENVGQTPSQIKDERVQKTGAKEIPGSKRSYPILEGICGYLNDRKVLSWR